MSKLILASLTAMTLLSLSQGSAEAAYGQVTGGGSTCSFSDGYVCSCGASNVICACPGNTITCAASPNMAPVKMKYNECANCGRTGASILNFGKYSTAQKDAPPAGPKRKKNSTPK